MRNCREDRPRGNLEKGIKVVYTKSQIHERLPAMLKRDCIEVDESMYEYSSWLLGFRDQPLFARISWCTSHTLYFLPSMDYLAVLLFEAGIVVKTRSKGYSLVSRTSENKESLLPTQLIRHIFVLDYGYLP